MTEKIGYKNWLSSARKWVKIVKEVKRKQRFTWPRGFSSFLTVVGECGYCEIFITCSLCPLFLKKIENLPICFKSGLVKTHFSCFVNEMCKNEPSFIAALAESKIVLTAILDDCPDKKQAIRDGIVFE